MSDYIRKDDVLALLKKYIIEFPSTYSVGLTTAKNAVQGMPTEDVVPIAEVSREIFEEIEQAIFAHGTKYAMKRLEELKKKYEVTDDGK